MPTYVYRDLVTGDTFELTQAIADEPIRVSPHTGNPVQRVPQRPLITFRGPGFAANDLKRK